MVSDDVPCCPYFSEHPHYAMAEFSPGREVVCPQANEQAGGQAGRWACRQTSNSVPDVWRYVSVYVRCTGMCAP